MDDYKKSLKNNLDATKDYYKKSIVKTEQQKMLEKLLRNDNQFISAREIADVACGGGTLSYHLSNISKANFTLIDYMEESISMSKELNKKNYDRFIFKQENIYDLKINNHIFDVTFCWQTLSWLENPREALMELIRITKKGGKIYLSSLFNFEYDVDIYSKVIDHTRESISAEFYINYNTYSLYTIEKWLEANVTSFEIHRFIPSIDFKYNGKGLGTFTQQCKNERIQISAGMLMQWGILEIEV